MRGNKGRGRKWNRREGERQEEAREGEKGSQGGGGRCKAGRPNDRKRGRPDATESAEQRRTARVGDQQRGQARAAAAVLSGRTMFKFAAVALRDLRPRATVTDDFRGHLLLATGVNNLAVSLSRAVRCGPLHATEMGALPNCKNLN